MPETFTEEDFSEVRTFTEDDFSESRTFSESDFSEPIVSATFTDEPDRQLAAADAALNPQLPVASSPADVGAGVRRAETESSKPEFDRQYAELNQYFDSMMSAIPSDNIIKRAEIYNAKAMAVQELNERAKAQGVPFQVLGYAPEKRFVERATAETLEPLGITGTPAKVAAGLQNIGADFLEMFKDPYVLGSMGLAKVAPETAHVIGRAFGAQMLTHSPAQAKAIYDAWKSRDTTGVVREIGNLAVSLGFGTKLTTMPDKTSVVTSTERATVNGVDAAFDEAAKRGMEAVEKNAALIPMTAAETAKTVKPEVVTETVTEAIPQTAQLIADMSPESFGDFNRSLGENQVAERVRIGKENTPEILTALADASEAKARTMLEQSGQDPAKMAVAVAEQQKAQFFREAIRESSTENAQPTESAGGAAEVEGTTVAAPSPVKPAIETQRQWIEGRTIEELSDKELRQNWLRLGGVPGKVKAAKTRPDLVAGLENQIRFAIENGGQPELFSPARPTEPPAKAQTDAPTENLTPDEQARLNEELAETQGAIATGGPPLAPTPAATPTLTPKSQRLIIQDLAKGLNIPIRFRRLTTSKFAGYFKKGANLIGSKRPNDIPIVSHEVGHKIDDSFSISKDPAIASELNVLGDPATPGSRSSWTPSKSKSYKMGEGLAEFVRHWLTDPAAAIKAAPNTHAAFDAILSANKDIGDVMRQAQGDIQTWRNAEPQARLRSHISIGENPNKTRYTLSQLTRDLVDDLHYLKLAVEHGESGRGSALPPSKNPYLLARNLRGSYGMADTFIRSGEVDFNTKEVKLGSSLEDALKPVSGRLSDFRDWIVAKRAQELHKQGRETGLVDSDVQYTAKKFDADPEFQKAFADVKAWNDSLLQYSIDSGLITPKSADAMRSMNQDYVPFSRVFEVGAGEMPSQQSSGIGMGLNVGKPGSLKRLHGSARDIVDPLETMVKNAYVIVTASEKAAINRAVAEMSNLPDMGRWVERVAAPKERVQLELERIRKQLETAGADVSMLPDDFLMSFFKPSGKAPFGENIIRVVRDGEPQFYRLQRDLHDTFQALDLEDAGALVRILSAPAQLLRSGVVMEPSFSISNALRDTVGSAVIGKFGALPFETTVRGVGAMINNPKMVAEWAASGGRSAVEASYFDRAKLQKFLAERISKDLTPSERALVITKSPLTALRWLTSVAEEATRIGEYQKAYNSLTKGGMPLGEARRLAAFEARDRQDFAKGGAKTKIIRHMAAFWNAQLQANVKLAQSFKQRPVKTTLKGLAFITTAKLLEQAVNWDDEDYWDRPQWERDLFFLIPAGKDDIGHTRFIRIPTPFEVGLIFGTLPGRLLQWAREKRPESMKGFPTLMLKQSIPNPTPQAAQMIFEVFLSGDQGWDVWRGRPIVPDSLADLPPELQWTEQTSRLAKEVGKRMGMSPMKIDHIIDQTSGGMGKILTGRQVPGKRFVTTPLAQSNQAVTEFYDILDDMRKQQAAAKATGEGDKPSALAAFEHASKQFSKLRDQARDEKQDVKKLELQNQIFQEAKELVDRYKADPESISALRVDPRTGAIKSGNKTIYSPEK